MNTLIEELKRLIISSLDLEDVNSADIDARAPLFGDGLGLDSIDALELGLAVQKKYGIKLDTNLADAREYFHSVESLAGFIRAQQQV